MIHAWNLSRTLGQEDSEFEVDLGYIHRKEEEIDG